MKNQPLSEEMQDVIGTPPRAILRWGITWVFMVILGIIAISAFIYYPDVVKTSIQIHTTNSPKSIVSKTNGIMVKLLVPENREIKSGEVIAWMESTANHTQILTLDTILKNIQEKLILNTIIAKDINGAIHDSFINPVHLRLGELQQDYQSFYLYYLGFRSTLQNEIYVKRRDFIEQEIEHVKSQKTNLENQQLIVDEEIILAEEEFNRYKTLMEHKVISLAEFEKQKAIYLSKRHSPHQIEASILNSNLTIQAKVREIADLDHQIKEEQLKFTQALNSILSQIEEWKMKYLLIAPQSGILVYAGIIQENQYFELGQEIFTINPKSTDFFGEMHIPQYNLGKVLNEQQVLVKLDGYPFEEFGIIRGQIDQINPVPVKDSIFLAKVKLNLNDLDHRILLRPGLLGTAEIITEDASLLSRLYRNIKLIVR